MEKKEFKKGIKQVNKEIKRVEAPLGKKVFKGSVPRSVLKKRLI